MTAIFSVWGMPVGFFTGGKMTLPASSSRRTSVLHTSAMATAASIWLRVQTFSHWRPHTLPHSSAIIINLGIADQDMKEAYPPMAVTTILTTAVGTAAVAIFMSLFPSLP